MLDKLKSITADEICDRIAEIDRESQPLFERQEKLHAERRAMLLLLGIIDPLRKRKLTKSLDECSMSESHSDGH